jgi:hypothetical protein
MSSGPFIVVVFVTRKPTLSPEEFKDHWENKHVPLLKSLAGPRFPLSHRRHYLSRDPSAPDYPLRVAVGQPEDFDFDAFTVVTFESEAAFKQFVPTMTRPEVFEDEDRFTVRERMKAVILGETNIATRE